MIHQQIKLPIDMQVARRDGSDTLRKQTDAANTCPIPMPIGSKGAASLFRFFAYGGDMQEEIHYIEGVGNVSVKLSVEVSGKYGPPSQFDKRFLDHVRSLLARQFTETGSVPKTVRVNVADYMRETNPYRTGRIYARLRDVLNRLEATRVRASIRFDEVSRQDYEMSFAWAPKLRIDYDKKTTANGDVVRHMSVIEFDLCDWLHEALVRDPSIIALPQRTNDSHSGILNRLADVLTLDGNKVVKLSHSQLYACLGRNWSEARFKVSVREACRTHLKKCIDQGGTPYALPGYSMYGDYVSTAHPVEVIFRPSADAFSISDECRFQ